MASYFIQILDNADGSFTLASCLRGSTGGVNLLPTRSGGDAVSKTFGWSGQNGGFQGQPGEVLFKAIAILEADRGLNG